MRSARALVLCAVAAAAACHGDSAQAPAARPAAGSNAAPAVKRGPKADELTVGMVEAASLGKSQVPLALKFELLQRPAAGQPLLIGIALLPQVAASAATLQIDGMDGLEVAPADSRIEIPVLEPEQVYRQKIKVTPTREGVTFVGITVTLKHDEITESRAFSVPVIVNAAAEH